MSEYTLRQRKNDTWQILKDGKTFIVLHDKTELDNIGKLLDALNADAKMRSDRAKAGRVKNPRKGHGGGRKVATFGTCPKCGKGFSSTEYREGIVLGNDDIVHKRCATVPSKRTVEK